MDIEKVNFNDLPEMVVQIFKKLEEIELAVKEQIKQPTLTENYQFLLTTKEASEILKMPMATLYAKLANGSIPAYKPGKNWVIKFDQLMNWLDNYRNNASVKNDDEINADILSAQKRKPKSFNF